MGFFGPDKRFSGETMLADRMREYGEIATRTGGAAERGVTGYLERAEAFDPSQAVTEYGQGFLDEAFEGLGRDFESLAGTSVGQGRLRSGFFQRGQQDLFQDFNRRVANAIAMQSLNAANLDLANIQGLGRFGSDMQAQQIDLLAGALDRATAEENAGVSGAELVGTLGGALLGGPGGAAIGGAVAGGLKEVGGWIKGLF